MTVEKQMYPCPCCGNYTLDEKPTGTDDICEVCFWQDDNIQFYDHDYWGGANKVSLNEARENYAKIGAKEERVKDYCRKPYEWEKPGNQTNFPKVKIWRNAVYNNVNAKFLEDELKNVTDEEIVRVDASQVHDDKSFCSTLKAAFKVEGYLTTSMLEAFDDDFGDFLADEYRKNHKNYILVLENWDKMVIDKEFPLLHGRICNWRTKDEYLESLEGILKFLGFDPTDPEHEAVDFTVFVVKGE